LQSSKESVVVHVLLKFQLALTAYEAFMIRLAKDNCGDFSSADRTGQLDFIIIVVDHFVYQMSSQGFKYFDVTGLMYDFKSPAFFILQDF